jgi:alanyl-tRNA synthetase
LLNSKLLAIDTETSGSNDALNEQLEVSQGSNKSCILVLDRTNFFPEGGGQASDEGLLTFGNGIVFHVNNVQHIQDYSFHTGELSIDAGSLEGGHKITLNDACQMSVDARKRYDTTMNHTAVHLLNHALR